MTNLTKIFRLLLVAVFCCMLMPNNSDAASGMTCLEGKVLYNGVPINIQIRHLKKYVEWRFDYE